MSEREDLYRILVELPESSFYQSEEGLIIEVARNDTLEFEKSRCPLILRVYDANGNFLKDYIKRYESVAIFYLSLPAVLSNGKYSKLDPPAITSRPNSMPSYFVKPTTFFPNLSI